MENLEWFDLIYNDINYGEWYKITKNGDIFSVRKNKILKQFVSTKGYLICQININCKKMTIINHHALACTFIQNIENKSQVNHIDGNKLNNNLDNLEWCTNSENQLHAFKNGLNNKKDNRKFSDEDILSIREEYKNEKTSHYKLSLKYGVSQKTIWKILTEKTYKN